MSSVRGTPIDPDDLDPSRLGREGFVQRLLTRLILGCDPSGWNRPALPTKRGLEFVIRFEELCLGSHGNTDLHFVDEFELPSRHPEERAGWPDYAVVRVERLLLIELKTERNSHQRGQLSRYNDLARTHHPEVARDLVYVTPTMWLRDEPQPGIGERFRHVSWAELRPLIAATRTMAPDPIEQRRLERLLETLDAVEAPSPFQAADFDSDPRCATSHRRAVGRP